MSIKELVLCAPMSALIVTALCIVTVMLLLLSEAFRHVLQIKDSKKLSRVLSRMESDQNKYNGYQ